MYIYCLFSCNKPIISVNYAAREAHEKSIVARSAIKDELLRYTYDDDTQTTHITGSADANDGDGAGA